jgi:hypothetical protein
VAHATWPVGGCPWSVVRWRYSVVSCPLPVFGGPSPVSVPRVERSTATAHCVPTINNEQLTNKN